MTSEYANGQNLDRTKSESTDTAACMTRWPATFKAKRLARADPEYRIRENVKNLARIIGYRTSLLTILGGVCSNAKCLVPGGCKDIRCLQLDHINGGGNGEVRKFKQSAVMYLHYLNHLDEARAKLQVLCANCNWIKRAQNKEVSKIGRPRTVVYPLVC